MYEEVEQLQVTRSGHPFSTCPSTAPGSAAAYMLTECPAYGQADLPPTSAQTSSQPQVPEYEDMQVTKSIDPLLSLGPDFTAAFTPAPLQNIQVPDEYVDMQVTPSGVSDLAVAYTITQCSAYAQDSEAEAMVDHPPAPPQTSTQPQVPDEYVDMQATRNTDTMETRSTSGVPDLVVDNILTKCPAYASKSTSGNCGEHPLISSIPSHTSWV